jgi:hypothetical protein
LHELGVATDHALYRNTVRAWIASVEAAALDWLEHGTPDKTLLVRMQTAALADRLSLVHSLDPAAAADGAMTSVLATQQKVRNIP